MKHTFLFLSLIGVLLSAQEGKVGINTDNPKSTLDVNGNMNIRKLGDYVKESSPLTWNPQTFNFSGGKTFNKLRTYTFFMKTTRSNAEQLYGDLNTNIDASKYELFISSWTFDNERNRIESYDDKVGYNHVYWTKNKLNPIPIVEAYIDRNNIWHLRAQFACAENKSDYGPTYWGIETMILPKGFARHIAITSSVSVDGSGTPQGSLDNNPLGDSVPLSKNNEVVEYTPVTNSGVGVNVENPLATLHINGNLAVEDISTPSEKSKFIYRNDLTGEIIKAPIKDKPIYNVNFFTPTDRYANNNNDRDRVNFYDTRIPKDKFYVIINEATFTSGNDLNTDVGITHENTGGREYNPAKFAIITDVRPDGSRSDTWGIRLDYVNAGPGKKWLDEHSGQYPGWIINTLIVSNEFMKDIDDLNLVNGIYRKEYLIDSDGNATADPLNGLD